LGLGGTGTLTPSLIEIPAEKQIAGFGEVKKSSGTLHVLCGSILL
jgi:hypothetical protein